MISIINVGHVNIKTTIEKIQKEEPNEIIELSVDRRTLLTGTKF
ncbi:MAG: hypothetical protein ACPGJV_07110 [Bacteriovoracaceae bacterium]